MAAMSNLAGLDKELIEAAGTDSIERMKSLLISGASVNASYLNASPSNAWNPWTPLHEAASKNHVKATRLLIQNGADLFAVASLSTPIQIAQINRGETLKLLLEAEKQQKVLMRMVKEADLKGLEAVAIQEQFITLNFHENDDKRWSLLHHAVHYASQDAQKGIGMIKYLLENGADPNIADSSGNTPLHFSAAANQPQVILLLLDYKANINAKTQDQSTPLLSALSAGHSEAVICLMEKGADIFTINAGGLMPVIVESAGEIFITIKQQVINGKAPQQIYKIDLRSCNFSLRPDLKSNEPQEQKEQELQRKQQQLQEQLQQLEQQKGLQQEKLQQVQKREEERKPRQLEEEQQQLQRQQLQRQQEEQKRKQQEEQMQQERKRQEEHMQQQQQLLQQQQLEEQIQQQQQQQQQQLLQQQQLEKQKQQARAHASNFEVHRDNFGTGKSYAEVAKKPASKNLFGTNTNGFSSTVQPRSLTNHHLAGTEATSTQNKLIESSNKSKKHAESANPPHHRTPTVPAHPAGKVAERTVAQPQKSNKHQNTHGSSVFYQEERTASPPPPSEHYGTKFAPPPKAAIKPTPSPSTSSSNEQSSSFTLSNIIGGVVGFVTGTSPDFNQLARPTPSTAARIPTPNESSTEDPAALFETALAQMTNTLLSELNQPHNYDDRVTHVWILLQFISFLPADEPQRLLLTDHQVRAEFATLVAARKINLLKMIAATFKLLPSEHRERARQLCKLYDL